MVALIVGLVVSSVVIAGIAAVFLGRPETTQPAPLPPSSRDGFALFIDSVRVVTKYGGWSPTRDHWLAVNATVRNNGTTSGFFKPGDWEVADPDGRPRSSPDQRLYGSQTIGSAVYATYWLPFDLTAGPQPDRLILTLPNGHQIGSPLSGGPRAVGIYMARLGDGTNWSLTITSRPDGLTIYGTTLTVFTDTGVVALGTTRFSALSYPTDYVAYETLGDGIAVGVGDRLLVSTIAYPGGYRYQISDGTAVLANGAFLG